ASSVPSATGLPSHRSCSWFDHSNVLHAPSRSRTPLPQGPSPSAKGRSHRGGEPQMRVLLSYLPLLGCAGAMVACMRMMRGRSNSEAQPDSGEIGELRAEVARLRAQVRVRSDDPSVQE